jgi:hypothetical protein
VLKSIIHGHAWQRELVSVSVSVSVVLFSFFVVVLGHDVMVELEALWSTRIDV